MTIPQQWFGRSSQRLSSLSCYITIVLLLVVCQLPSQHVNANTYPSCVADSCVCGYTSQSSCPSHASCTQSTTKVCRCTATYYCASTSSNDCDDATGSNADYIGQDSDSSCYRSGWKNYPVCSYQCSSKYYTVTGCDSGYYGATCSSSCPSCTSAAAGSCSAGIAGTGLCVCNTNYAGTNCQYSKQATCNNHGTPTATGGCINCDTGWTGSSCNICSSGYGGSTCTLCPACVAGQGTCSSQSTTGAATCVCYNGYNGNLCQYSNATTCSGHGVAKSDGTCTCATGYASNSATVAPYCSKCAQDWYQYPVCIKCTDGEQCSSHGSCQGSNGQGVCTCNTGYTGTSCNQCSAGYFGSSCTACPGGAATPCNGHGTCNDGTTGNGQCTCTGTYVQASCQYSSADCTNHGTPNGVTGACTCSTGFAGTKCTQCNAADNYYNYPNCVQCTSNTCFGSGSCTQNGTCSCNAGYAAPNCQYCATNWYGSPCVYCMANDTCNSHGTCITSGASAGTCQCDSVGFVAGCKTCKDGYWGSNCSPCPGGAANQCNAHGTCNVGITNNGFCNCYPGYSGVACSLPTISLVTPATAPTAGGIILTIQGKLLGTSSSLPIIAIGSTPVTYCLNPTTSDSQLFTCTLPAGQPSLPNGNATINITRRADGVIAAPWLWFYTPPAITTIVSSNAATAGGGSMTVTGTNMGLTADIIWNGINIATVSVVTHSQATFTIPAGGGTPSISVRVGGVVSNALTWTYDAPSITIINPTHNLTTAGNSNITIQGTNLGGGVPGIVSVIIGTTGWCTITQQSDTIIVCTVSAGAAVQAVRVNVAGQITAPTNIFYLGPTLTGAAGCVDTPPLALDCPTAGGTRVNIMGDNLGATVTVNGTTTTTLIITIGAANLPCSNLIMVVPHQIVSCVLPAAVGPLVRVTVTRHIMSSSAFVLGFAGPYFTVNTLDNNGIYQSIGGVHAITVNSTNGGDVITLYGRNFGTNNAAITITYGSVNRPDIYTCGHISNAANTSLTCVTQPGVGQNLYFKAVVNGIESPYSTDYMNYPGPILTNGTLRFFADGTGGGTLRSLVTTGELVVFNGRNFGSVPSEILVTYGPQQLACTLSCTPFSPCNDTQITCRTNPGDGFDLTFTVTTCADDSCDQSTTGADTYSYPQAPHVLSVTGCSDQDGSVTSDCPTSGSINGTASGALRITVNGLFLGLNGTSISVGTTDCASVIHVTGQETTQLTCLLPAGTGVSQAVLVQHGDFYSIAAPLVSYAVPTISLITGCNSVAGTNASTVGCNRAGGQILTLIGDNFGASQAKVLVGGTQCLNVVHDTLTPHQKLRCTLQAGSGLLRSILLIQYRGSMSADIITLSYQPCVIGFYAPQGVTTCTQCSAGTYANLEGMTSCLSCDTGAYADGVAPAATCTPCDLGTYGNTTGLSTCSICPSGTYSPNAARSSCLSCSKGTFSLYDGGTVGPSSCRPCGLGSASAIIASSSCDTCQVGQYAAEGFETCVICDAGQAQGQAGQSSCSTCTAGKASISGASSCTTCVDGKYSATAGLTTCSTCSAGTISNAIATGSTANTKCDPCVAGRHSVAAVNGSTSCVICETGTVATSSGASVCAQCARGRYPLSDHQSCVACAQGSYAATAGMAACIACDAGKMSTTTGSYLCLDCALGTYSQGGASICTTCASGTRPIVSSGATGCLACDVGTYAFDRKCVSCSAGSYTNQTLSITCTTCAANSVTIASGLSVCTTCTTGRAPSSDRTACIQCAAGRAAVAGASECSTCAVGTFQDVSEQATCKPAYLGYHASVSGLTYCSACDPGEYSGVEGAQTCSICDAGKTSVTGSSSCGLCAAGYYAESQSSESCLPCDYGSFTSGNGSLICDQCSKGKSASQRGQSICDDCQPGRAASTDGRDVCASCAAGTYANTTGLTTCISCDIGKVASDSGFIECTPCATGRYQSFQRQSACIPCAVGGYANATGSTACVSCAFGAYQDTTSQSVCKQCTPGTYSSDLGLDSCKECPEGKYTQEYGVSECRACQGGRYRSVDFVPTDCIDCPSGKYSSGNAGSCDDCPSGTYSNLTAQIICASCDAGRYQPDTGAPDCRLCPVGAISGTKATLCTKCAPGSFSATNGSDACTACDPGTWQEYDGESFCNNCTAGTFNPSPKQEHCLLCILGKSTNFTSQIECQSCAEGKAQGVEGEFECDFCTPGKFTALPGQSVCQLCPFGRYSDVYNATECLQCSPGYYQDREGSTNCTLCPFGEATTAYSQRSCQACVPGRFTNQTGLLDCIACEQGKSQRAERQSSCDYCGVGKFMTITGSPECSSCDVGTYQPGTGQLACLPCSSGSYYPVEGGTGCIPCAAGSYSGPRAQICSPCGGVSAAPLPGASECQPCPSNSAPTLDRKACQCGIGWYALPGNTSRPLVLADDGGLYCSACPVGSDCSKVGTTWLSIATRAGYWRSSNETHTYYKCLVVAYCEGGVDSTCQGNRGGPLCSLCLPGYMEQSTGACTACPPTQAGSWVLLFFLLGVVGLIIWIAFWIVVRNDRALLNIAVREAIKRIRGGMTQTETTGQVLRKGDEWARTRGQSIRTDMHASLPLADTTVDYVGTFQSKSFASVPAYTAPLTRAASPSTSSINAASKSAVDDIFSEDNTDNHLSEGVVLGSHRKTTGQAAISSQLKILMSFFQIITHLADVLEVPWPSAYRYLVGIFDFVNLDFMSIANPKCANNSTYYDNYLLVMFLPVFIVVGIIVFFFVPQYIRGIHFSGESPQTKQILVRSLLIQCGKLCCFSLFVIYPRLSSGVLRLFVCTPVDGKYYLVADFTQECYTSKWYSYAISSMITLALYPVGIPCLFFYLLYRFRHRGLELPVRYSIGFLYEAYNKHVWWFEIVDMFHKLWLTSLLGFFPDTAQLPVGMVISILYTIVILVGQPYYRPLDDRLHLFAQAGIFMFMLSGQVFINSDTIDETTDVAMSVFLIGALVMFLGVFFLNFGRGLLFLFSKFTGGLVRQCPDCYCVRLHARRQSEKRLSSSEQSSSASVLPRLDSPDAIGSPGGELMSPNGAPLSPMVYTHDVELHAISRSNTVVS